MSDVLTIQQLDDWMTANCYNDSYAIGSRRIHEGYGLTRSDGLYVWYYTERGARDNLTYFQTEQDAVAFAFRTITADKLATRHLIGFLTDKTLEQELVAELGLRGVSFWRDEIPYGGWNSTSARIFVFGCDLRKVLDLQEKYGL